MTRRPPASSFWVTPPITFLATASGLMIEKVRSIAMTWVLQTAGVPRSLQQLGEGLAHLGGRRRHRDTGGLEGRDLGLGVALATRDDRAGVAHALARRRGDAGDERRDRLLDVVLDELGG